MAQKIKSVTLRFVPSGSPDVVEYKLYYEKVGTDVTHDSESVTLGNPDPDATTGKIHIDVSALGVFTDGRYNIGIAAVDDAGNESALSKKADVPFDFIAPDAPGEIQVVAI